MANITAQSSSALETKTKNCLDLLNYTLVDVDSRYTLTRSEVSSSFLKEF